MICGQLIARADSVNLKASPGTLTPLLVGGAAAGNGAFGIRFLPLFAFVHLRTMTGGALTTGPGIRIGTNANHNDVCPAVTAPTSVTVGQIVSLALASPLQAPPIATNDIIVEITQSAVGPTSMTGDFLIFGLIVG